jgi:hypothetical protein
MRLKSGNAGESFGLGMGIRGRILSKPAATRVLALTDTLAEGRERDLLELSVRIDLGGPLIATKGYNAAEPEEKYEKC